MICVALYKNRASLDAWAVEDERDGVVTFCQEILELMYDDESSAEHWRTAELIADGDFDKAIQIWCQIEEESFEVRRFESEAEVFKLGVGVFRTTLPHRRREEDDVRENAREAVNDIKMRRTR